MSIISISPTRVAGFIASWSLLLAVGCGARTAAQPTTSVSIDAARRTALARVPGQVIEEELEEDDGRWVYEFDIRPTGPGAHDQEVVVDANSGQIVKVEAED